MNITEIATAILPSVMEIIGTIAMIMAAKIGIPWLREQRIFSLVRKLVKGAEKAAEAGKIPKTDKHALVIKLLKMKNIEVTPFLDAFIDAAIKEMASLIDLCVDICKRNGIQRLNFTGDKTGNLTMHCYFKSTLCPGPYLKSKFPYIAREVNKRLGAEATPEPFIVQITASSLNVRKGPGTSYAVAQTVRKGQVFTIVQQQGGWGKLKSGAGWISLKYTARK